MYLYFASIKKNVTNRHGRHFQRSQLIVLSTVPKLFTMVRLLRALMSNLYVYDQLKTHLSHDGYNYIFGTKEKTGCNQLSSSQPVFYAELKLLSQIQPKCTCFFVERNDQLTWQGWRSPNALQFIDQASKYSPSSLKYKERLYFTDLKQAIQCCRFGRLHHTNAFLTRSGP